MAEIIIFPGGRSPHRAALALERRGFRVDPLSGRATVRATERNTQQGGERHEPHPAA